MSPRRLPDPATGQQRFKFAAPGELTSISVPLPLYHLPPLPEPDQPLRQPLPAAKLLPVEVGGAGVLWGVFRQVGLLCLCIAHRPQA